MLACNQAKEAVGHSEGILDWPAEHSGPFRALLENAVLTGYIESLCGADYVLDKPPGLVAEGAEGTAGVPLSMGPPEDRRRLRYANYADTRVSKGLRVFLSLAPTPEDGGVVLAAGSHTRLGEPPAAF